MNNQFNVGGVIASLLCFVLFCLLKYKKNKKSRCLLQNQITESIKPIQDGECQEEIARNPDIIIVGAGVAGSALACTLGKVILHFPITYLLTCPCCSIGLIITVLSIRK